MKQVLIIIISILSLATVNAQQVIRFTNPDSLIVFAEKNSIAIKTGDAQVLLAKYQTLYAKINKFNPRASVNYAVTDNTQLPVSFFPAEIFGGTPGTFKEVRSGQQYVQSAYITPQIDVINPATWEKLKSARLNEQLASVNNKLTKKTLSESIAAAYFNIVSFQQQIAVTSKTLVHADSILQIFQNKFDQGIIRSQDVNNAKVNKLLIKDRLQQIQNAMEQQYNLLNLLCDADAATIIEIEHKESTNTTLQQPVIALNILAVTQSQLQLQYAKSEYKANKAGYYPNLSLIGNWAWQENSNLHFFDNNARWIPTSYIGLRLSYTFPDAGRLSQTATAKTNWKIAEMNVKHKTIQQETENVQLYLEFKRAKEIMMVAEEIKFLKEDTYRKNLNLFVQNIYPADNLFLAFNDALTATLNYQSATINMQYQLSKININNNVQ
jgi:OMF family outer membrane factor